MKLQSMTDFVLHTAQTPNINEAICWEQTEARLFKIYQYALFLKQPLQLGFFVPCDLEGNVLSDPNDKNCGGCEKACHECEISHMVWNEAQSRILFKGFDVSIIHNAQWPTIKTKCNDMIYNYGMEGFWPKFKTVEDLVKYNLTLTQSAITKIKGV